MNKTASIIILFFIIASTAFAVPASISKKVIQETIKLAAKKSGKTLKPAMRKAAEKALLQASKQYGDDVIKIVGKGGLETLEQGTKHGKVFWELCGHAPKAARSLAMHADDLMPIAKRIGPDFMKLEACVPGMGKEAVKCFGDDAVKMISKMPADDAAKLIKFGAKADSPKTARLLLEGCQKTSGTILKHLDGKRIVALGLSASMVVAASNISNGLEDGVKQMASQSPDKLTQAMAIPTVFAVLCGFVVLLWLFIPMRKWMSAKFAMIHSKK